MKYAIVNSNGGVELHEDSSMSSPAGAIQLSDAEFDDLRRGSSIIENGSVVVVKNWSPA